MNSDVAKTRQACRTILAIMEQAASRFATLPTGVRPALVLQSKKAHQSSISASVNRRGSWPDLQVTHILSMGVQIDANPRTRDTFVRLDEQIVGAKAQYSRLHDIAQFLQSLQDDLAEGTTSRRNRLRPMVTSVQAPLFALHVEVLNPQCARRFNKCRIAIELIQEGVHFGFRLVDVIHVVCSLIGRIQGGNSVVNKASFKPAPRRQGAAVDRDAPTLKTPALRLPNLASARRTAARSAT